MGLDTYYDLPLFICKLYYNDTMTDDFPDNSIYKRDLRRFFVALREQAHPIYALLKGAPKSAFWIVLENDDLECEEQTYSLQEFYANLAAFHDCKDTFRIYFDAYFFREEWDECLPGWEAMDNPFNGQTGYEIRDKVELTVTAFKNECLHLLASFCRKQIVANVPFKLDRGTIRQYKFSREDVKQLREPVARINERIIAELRAQYDALAAIDCLHDTLKGERTKVPGRVPMLNG